MSKFPILKPQQVIAILEKLGFTEVRQKGSHKHFKHSDGRYTPVPFSKRKRYFPILVKQIGITN